MSEKILVPILGESISEATIVKWLKKKGESVEIDEPIVELETDKVNLEVPSPVDGILSEINAKDGQVVEVGTVLGLVTNGKIETSKKEVTKKKQTIEKPEAINDLRANMILMAALVEGAAFFAMVIGLLVIFTIS